MPPIQTDSALRCQCNEPIVIDEPVLSQELWTSMTAGEKVVLARR